MPSAPKPFCAESGCWERVSRGRCATHRREKEHTRILHHGSRQQRGYDKHWDYFRTVVFPDLLVEQGIVPACGARLCGTPSPYSVCAQQGLVNMEDLHLDHEPPLLPHERTDVDKVCDPLRVQLLCRSDHSRKTRTQQ